MASFDELASVAASTKRGGAVASGLEAAYAVNIVALACTPLDPINSELTLGIEGLGWRETLYTYTEGGLDIVEGDLLVVAGTEYPIRAVGEYEWRGSEYKQLILEDPK